MLRAALLLACAALPVACVSAEWHRAHGLVEPPREAFATLVPGQADLGDCLENLGAPLLVWEEPAGAALAWGWYEEDTLAGGVSVPMGEAFSASFDARDVDANMRGLVLLFDNEWTLRIVRRGRLRELATYAGQRPIPPDLVLPQASPPSGQP